MIQQTRPTENQQLERNNKYSSSKKQRKRRLSISSNQHNSNGLINNNTLDQQPLLPHRWQQRHYHNSRQPHRQPQRRIDQAIRPQQLLRQPLANPIPHGSSA